MELRRTEADNRANNRVNPYVVYATKRSLAGVCRSAWASRFMRMSGLLSGSCVQNRVTG